MTNEELMRIYTADPENAEDAMVQLYEQNMDLIWDIARNSAKAFNCLNATSVWHMEIFFLGFFPVRGFF